MSCKSFGFGLPRGTVRTGQGDLGEPRAFQLLSAGPENERKGAPGRGGAAAGRQLAAKELQPLVATLSPQTQWPRLRADITIVGIGG